MSYVPGKAETESRPMFDAYWPDEEFRQAFDTAYAATGAIAAKAPAAKPAERPKRRGKLKTLIVFMATLIVCYCVAVFSDIPFVAKWRRIYIETAMSTMTHQWLATAFIPKGVIDEVMLKDQALQMEQAGLSSKWSMSPISKKDLYLPWKKAESKFAKIYPEIDQASFKAYIGDNPDGFINDNGFLVIDKAGLKDKAIPVKTTNGDRVLAIDTENAITIVRVEGDGYVGRLAIVKDPSRVGLGLSENFDQKGSKIGELANFNNAVLAINASGFYDPDGTGNGGNAYGLVISKGEILKEPVGGTDKTIAFDKNNKLNIGNFKSMSNFRDAVEFKPALIINGEVLVEGSAGWGLHPRSAIGQTKNGEVLILIVDGRAPGYSIGCTVGEVAQIMKRYGAYQACNLDGGSSSLMYYNGREISKPSAANKKTGRSVPNGFVVYKRES